MNGTAQSIMYPFVLLLLAAPPASAGAQATLKEPETGRRFAAARTLDGAAHVCLGVGVREFLVFDVYAAAFYVERDRGRKAFARFLKRHGSAFRTPGGYDYSNMIRQEKTTVAVYLASSQLQYLMEVVRPSSSQTDVASCWIKGHQAEQRLGTFL